MSAAPRREDRNERLLELAVFAGDATSAHTLPPEGRVSIGRASGNDVRIDHASVSRRHAVLHVGANIRIEDLGGANGTFVRDPEAPTEAGVTHAMKRLSKASAPLAVGERVTLGFALLVVRKATAESVGEELPASASADDGLVVRGPSMRALYDQARRAAQALISVLLLGETGVGKEVLARAIHTSSSRARGPLLALNCAALSESLLESELFGHEKGAFTGATSTRDGLFEAANGGTVFLDEVGDLPLPIQGKLLRVLEDRRVTRVGGRTAKNIDVRFISATNRDLEWAIRKGLFRQDLFFRLNGITLTVPPLRDRVSEIDGLARGFLAKACRQLDRERVPDLAPDALVVLERHRWPGNVRELRNVVERAVVLCEDGPILPEHLPAGLVEPSAAEPADGEAPELAEPIRVGARALAAPSAMPMQDADASGHLRSEMAALERDRILQALDRCAGNQTRAAALLGISRRTLSVRLDEYRLPRPRKKP